MTVNTLRIELSCNGRTLAMGPGEDLDITEISGLESPELEISTSDNALVDGESVDGKKIGKRSIHIEAKFRSGRNNPENRGAVIKFFNPKYTGKALIMNMGISRNIGYELEGWTSAHHWWDSIRGTRMNRMYRWIRRPRWPSRSDSRLFYNC